MNLKQKSKLHYIVAILTTLILLTQSEYYFPVNNRDTIVFIFHGFGDTCESIENYWAPMMREDAFNNVFCVKSGDGISESVLANMDKQVENAILHINSVYEDERYQEQFQKGVFFLGLSQGGIIARLVFNNSPGISNHVRRLITFGTPHSGIESVPGTEYSNLSAFLNYVVQTSFGSWLSSAGYYIGKDDMSEMTQGEWYKNPFYKLNCNFNLDAIEELIANGQISSTQKEHLQEFVDDCKEIKERYNRLEMFVSVAYKQDETIKPLESPLFGAEFVEKRTSGIQLMIKQKQTELQAKVDNYKYQANLTKQEITNYQNSPNFKNSMKDKHHIENLTSKFNYQRNSLRYYESKVQLIDDDIDFIEGEIKRKLEEDPDYKFYSVNGVANTRAIANNASSLKNLYQTNRLLFCTINAGHLATTASEIAFLAVRMFGLKTPPTINNQNQYIISDQPYIDSEQIEGLRLYCDFSCLTFPKLQFRRLLI